MCGMPFPLDPNAPGGPTRSELLTCIHEATLGRATTEAPPAPPIPDTESEPVAAPRPCAGFLAAPQLRRLEARLARPGFAH
jgi:hypothetical protein